MSYESMTVCHPVNLEDHPYLCQLREALNRHGVELVDTRRQGALFLSWLAGSLPPLVHFHWMHPFFLPEGPFESHLWPDLRSRGFVRTLDALKTSGTKLVWTAHNLVNHERRAIEADRRCHRAMASRADGIIAHSDSAAERIQETFGVPSPRVRVIPHGHFIDWYPRSQSRAEARAALDIPDDAFVFGFFGNIRRYKQVPHLIQTYTEYVRSPATRLVIAGNPRTELLERDIREAAGGEPDVELYLDFVPDGRVQTFIKSSDAMVFPFHDILTSGSVILAMSMGRPVIAPRLGAMADLESKNHGFLYDPEHEGLSGAMQDALDAGDSLDDMGEAALECARRWDWNTIAAQTRALYDELL
jgi:glycosyltransferase involved in cell wall biosynthesis